MADPAPSSNNGPLKPDQEAACESSKDAAGATFANTKQHVADRQKATETADRFTNTKNNIALINDPKNGPRFTLTKKEAGLAETADAKAGATSSSANDATGKSAAKPNSAKVGGRDGVDGKDEASAKTPPQAEAKPGTDGQRQKAETPKPPSPSGPLGVPPAAEPPSKVPIDSSKTFVGPNGTYYDEAWRWMDWRGTKQSWNWPAALSFGHWFAYRRLWGHAGVYLAWLAGLTMAAVSHVHVALVLGLLVLTSVLIGLYANTLYFLVFRRAVAHVTERGKGSYDELKVQLAKAGGINRIGPWVMGAFALLVIGIALAMTLYFRGRYSINLWPFETLTILRADLIQL